MSSSNGNSQSYDHASKIEAAGGNTEQLERLQTAGGHMDDRSQPSLPVVHRRFANPAPLGLLSFATGIFLISIYGVQVRGVATPNVLIGVLIFFGGVCQFISGIMEFVSGNTFGATVFPSYGAFNISYAMIYLPGSGILAAYTDKTTGELNDQFPNALAMYLWAWFILTVIFTIAAMRSSWVLFADLFVLCIVLLLLACGYMLNNTTLEKAGSGLGFVVAFLSYWAGCAGLFANGITPINLPVFAMYSET
ncbi:Glyoxylate pathway regulator [Lachnellula occidentalis]|uniref:Glyoxylate pathway regulator n=1 Tax=Lachnellula occidentalis TaxID=215460 RepID=A0A8H8RJG9_9HELO|nr:Glyoxylate pathway regulator [Lachnellula occidentalis]